MKVLTTEDKLEQVDSQLNNQEYELQEREHVDSENTKDDNNLEDQEYVDSENTKYGNKLEDQENFGTNTCLSSRSVYCFDDAKLLPHQTTETKENVKLLCEGTEMILKTIESLIAQSY
ncbi:unnamed protein product, partial [Callosobruchus maculatus]